jgi:hypothetical protein
MIIRFRTVCFWSHCDTNIMNVTTQPSSLAASDNSSNNIALAAAILAAAAFIVATAQTVLEYASSSAARNKCAFSAIDASSKQVKLRWSWRFWRLRVYYPVLEFSVRRTLSLMMNATAKSIDGDHSPMQPIRRSHGWDWAQIEEKDNIKGKNIA